MSNQSHMPRFEAGTPSAAASCVRFLEAMELKHPRLFRGARGKLFKSDADVAYRTNISAAELEKMAELAREGGSVATIAEALGRTRVTVAKHLQRLGLYRITPRKQGGRS